MKRRRRPVIAIAALGAAAVAASPAVAAAAPAVARSVVAAPLAVSTPAVSPASGSAAVGGAWHVRVLTRAPVVRDGNRRFRPTQPDDVAYLGGHGFVVFQNNIGPQGQASPTGVTRSTVIEVAKGGGVLARWEVRGHADGLSADPATGALIGTVNEDAHSSAFRIDPTAKAGHQLQRLAYRPGNPLPHGGGTDAVAFYRGGMYLSASAPGTVKGSGTTAATSPAVYKAGVPGAHSSIVHLGGWFFDGSKATVANIAPPTQTPVSPKPSYGSVASQGTRVRLDLTDPDSNEVVPAGMPRFGGSFVLDSQGDEQLIFARPTKAGTARLSVLYLSQSIDDSAYVTDRSGTIYLTNAATDEILALRGPLVPGEVLVSASPGDANNPSTAPGYIGVLDLGTGSVTAIPALASIQPKGMTFVP